jgi:hypothetical protein
MMFEKFPLPNSEDAAANTAKRLRQLKADLRVVELAVQTAIDNEEDEEAIVTMLHRTIAEIGCLSDAILERGDQQSRSYGSRQ